MNESITASSCTRHLVSKKSFQLSSFCTQFVLIKKVIDARHLKKSTVCRTHIYIYIRNTNTKIRKKRYRNYVRHRGLDGTTLHLAYLHEAPPLLHVEIQPKQIEGVLGDGRTTGDGCPSFFHESDQLVQPGSPFHRIVHLV